MRERERATGERAPRRRVPSRAPPRKVLTEALEARAVVGQLAAAVEHEVDDLLADGVVAARVVVGRVLLARDELLRVVEVAVRARADLVHARRLEVDHQAARHELARARLREEAAQEAEVGREGGGGREGRGERRARVGSGAAARASEVDVSLAHGRALPPPPRAREIAREHRAARSPRARAPPHARVEGVVLDGRALGLLAVRLDAVLEAEELPAGVARLHARLAEVDEDDLAHLATRGAEEGGGTSERRERRRRRRRAGQRKRRGGEAWAKERCAGRERRRERDRKEESARRGGAQWGGRGRGEEWLAVSREGERTGQSERRRKDVMRPRFARTGLTLTLGRGWRRASVSFDDDRG